MRRLESHLRVFTLRVFFLVGFVIVLLVGGKCVHVYRFVVYINGSFFFLLIIKIINKLIKMP